jgi:hypothetical protein
MSPHSASAPRAAWFGLVLVLAALPARAQTDADELAQGLIRLRGEVEQLNGELELLREEQRTSLAALAAQKAELAATAERQQLAAREAREKLARQQATMVESGAGGERLVPVLLAAADALAAQVRAGLPFKTEERLAEIDAFRTQLQNGTLPPQRAVNRLWAFHEDEFRLTRENGLHAQTISLGGERVLAEVAKVGTMALYFRTQDGRLGQARRDGQAWDFVPIEDPAGQQQVAALFDALRKQIRQGFFELPLAARSTR